LRRLYIWTLLTILLGAVVIHPAQSIAAAIDFKDVPTYHWANKAVTWAKTTGMINGYPDGTFRPDKQVTEAEFLAMLVNAYHPKEPNIHRNAHWSDKYYNFAEQNNYHTDGSLKMSLRNEAITRLRVAEIIAGADGVHYNGDNAIHYLLAKGYASGKIAGKNTISSYMGKSLLTRAEAVQFIKNIKMKGVTSLKIRPLAATPVEQLPPLIEDQMVYSTLKVKDIVANESSVVMLIALKSDGEQHAFGTAFHIGNGLFLTNAHVLHGGSSYMIVTDQGEEISIEGIVRADNDLDLAIVKPVVKLNMKPLKLGSKHMVEKGDPIVTIGNPEGLTNTVSDGIVSGIRTLTENSKPVDVIQISAPITYGNSGGPLFSLNGYVVGVNSFGSESGNLNFAVAIDYANEWIKQDRLLEKDFSAITISADTLPAPVELEESQGNESTLDPTPAPAPTLPEDANEDVASLIDFTLKGFVKDALLHPVKNTLYYINDENNHVYSVNLDTKQTDYLKLSFKPEKLYFANGKLYVAMVKHDHNSYREEEQQSGAIVIIDLERWNIINRFDINIDPFDMVVDHKGFIYVSSGSSQWTNIKSYSKDGKEVSSRSIHQASYLALHPEMSRIVAINTDISPRDMQVFTISDGKLVSSKDSPYHGDYTMNPNIKISPDGQYIFNGAGTIFTSGMHYVNDLKRKYADVAFNLPENIFYLATSDGIIVYNYNDMKETGKIQTVGEPARLFVRDNQVVVITKIHLGGSIFGVDIITDEDI
jgi:serine protease Do